MPASRISSRVPAASVPDPHWVTTEEFEAQLQRIRRETPNPVHGLFGPDSMMWRIGRCHLASTLGSGRALLLQVAHPWVTQGVDHHSRTRTDPLGRARRTFKHVLSMTFGSLDHALSAALRVHAVHKRIRGALEYSAGGYVQGAEYRANETNALLWVHATLWDSAVRMYELVVEPLSSADKDRFYEETKLFAYLFGIPESVLPHSWSDFIAYNEQMWDSGQLSVTPAALDLTQFLFKPLAPGLGPTMRWMEMVTAATLPPRLREAFKLRYSDSTPARFDRTVQRMRRIHNALPDRFRYSPTYFEALARIEGRRSDVFTRTLTRATLGCWRLVS
jgi:uncharacterized protein (DUF2236 family)